MRGEGRKPRERAMAGSFGRAGGQCPGPGSPAPRCALPGPPPPRPAGTARPGHSQSARRAAAPLRSMSSREFESPAAGHRPSPSPRSDGTRLAARRGPWDLQSGAGRSLPRSPDAPPSSHPPGPSQESVCVALSHPDFAFVSLRRPQRTFTRGQEEGPAGREAVAKAERENR